MKLDTGTRRAPTRTAGGPGPERRVRLPLEIPWSSTRPRHRLVVCAEDYPLRSSRRTPSRREAPDDAGARRTSRSSRARRSRPSCSTDEARRRARGASGGFATDQFNNTDMIEGYGRSARSWPSRWTPSARTSGRPGASSGQRLARRFRPPSRQRSGRASGISRGPAPTQRVHAAQLGRGTPRTTRAVHSGIATARAAALQGSSRGRESARRIPDLAHYRRGSIQVCSREREQLAVSAKSAVPAKSLRPSSPPGQAATTQRSPCAGTRRMCAVMRPSTISPRPRPRRRTRPDSRSLPTRSRARARPRSTAPRAGALDPRPGRRTPRARPPRRGSRRRSSRRTGGSRSGRAGSPPPRPPRAPGAPEARGRPVRRGLGDEPLPVEEQRDAVVASHLERSFERWWQTERDLHGLGVDERREAPARVPAVRRRERAAVAPVERDHHERQFYLRPAIAERAGCRLGL